MDANERFERLADLFYRETHYMAPGKSVPAEMGSEDYDDKRRDAWNKWYDEFIADAIRTREAYGRCDGAFHFN